MHIFNYCIFMISIELSMLISEKEIRGEVHG